MMKLKSLSRSGGRLEMIDVEVQLIPGLPVLEILGSPGPVVRESAKRIKSAMASQGFQWPRAQQAIVNLRPTGLRKDDRGVELAIAAGILWESGQVRRPDSAEICVYGDLELNGQVGLEDKPIHGLSVSGPRLLTAAEAQVFGCETWRVGSLMDLGAPKIEEGKKFVEACPPALHPDTMITAEQALVVSVAALGEHSLLLAGPAGSGKTSCCDWVWRLMSAPSAQLWSQIQALHWDEPQKPTWRPFVSPHHTSSLLSLVGGGANPGAGEATRAHGGILVMDELLEWDPRVQEALREPVERGMIRIARAQHRHEYPCQFQMVATTNLCPCGAYVPIGRSRCRCATARVQKYLARLSGPIVDRFDLLVLTHRWLEQRNTKLSAVAKKIEAARQFQCEVFKAEGGEPIARQGIEQVSRRISRSALAHIEAIAAGHSMRRLKSLIRVTATLACLDQCEKADESHVNAAVDLVGLAPEASLYNLRLQI